MRPILYAGVIFSFFIAAGVLGGYVAHSFQNKGAQASTPVVERVREIVEVPEVAIAMPTVMPTSIPADLPIEVADSIKTAPSENAAEASTLMLANGDLRVFSVSNGDIWAATSTDGGVTWGTAELTVVGATSPNAMIVEEEYVLFVSVGGDRVRLTSADGYSFQPVAIVE